MSSMKNKFAKYKPYIFLAILLVSLLPLVWLGRYNYPTGDDYYYGVETHLAWQQTGNLAEAFAAACNGVADTYQNWQGTYSALFLMYLAPNAFSNTAYHLVTFVILLLLCGSIFYLLRPLICRFLPGTTGEWITISSVLSFLCIQTVVFQSDSFYWYNGSMYYTGFFAVTLFFLGTLLYYLCNGKRLLLLPLLLFAVFLGGGNYVSLLPCMLLLATATFLLLLKKDKKALICGITTVALLSAFTVSAMAPGNHVRQDGMWKIPAWKAIAKSLLQGIRYTFAWTGLWWFLAAILLLPVFLHILRRKNDAVSKCFSHPVLFTGYFYGLFCSMSCPLFYTMNSTGPGRAVAIVYYSFLLISFAVLFYWIGFVILKLQMRQNTSKKKTVFGKLKIARYAAMAILLAGILFTGLWQETSAAKAIRMLTNGEAAAYAAEYEERLLLLNNPDVMDVVLTPFVHQPAMIYTGDLPGDPEDPTSQKVALYFRKNSVYVNYNN